MGRHIKAVPYSQKIHIVLLIKHGWDQTTADNSWLVVPSPLFQRVRLLSYFLAGMYYHAFLPVPLTFQPPTFFLPLAASSCLYIVGCDCQKSSG